MGQRNEVQSRLRTHNTIDSEQAGRYVYCVARAGNKLSLEAGGIEGHDVYTVVHGDLCALVHDCPAKPYQSDNAETAAAWVLAHHQVVDATWKRWGAVLPLTFNTIITTGEKSAEENLVEWLETEYESLKERLDALIGKVEYGVQVFWDPTVVARKIAESSPEISKLQEEINSKSRGLAYMYRQKLERLLKGEMEARATEEFIALYDRIGHYVDNVHVEKPKEVGVGRQMLMNLSCLVSMERYPELEAELNRISEKEGYFTRLAGPLPPYSFC